MISIRRHHFRYKNIDGSANRKTTFTQLRRLYRGIKLRHGNLSSEIIDWVMEHNLSKQLENYKNKNYISWLGHASYLLRLDDKVLLIDPVFSQRASPLQWIGPKRIVAAPINMHQLPKIDYIMITHNHYDHLDKPFLKKLPCKETIKIICPLGLAKTIRKWGFHNITELGWHDSLMKDNLKITALPAYHYSSRGLFDKNKSWWCSYSISDTQLALFHSGDTGYGEIFKSIGSSYGPFDYAMIGIGAYKPKAMMKGVHISPKEALKIANDINTKIILPMHWGTFILTPERVSDPINKLKQLIESHQQFKHLTIALDKIGDIISI